MIAFIDTPAAYPGHRVGGARHLRGDRPQPARDGGARHADHRRRPRRRRQRRRARPGRRRPHPDARVRDLQRHPARRAARRSCGATRTRKVEAADGAEADGAGPAAARASSTRSSRSRPAARTPTTSWPRRCSTPRCERALAEVSADGSAGTARCALPQVAGDGERRARRRLMPKARDPHLGSRCRATTRRSTRLAARARRLADHRAAAVHPRPGRSRAGAALSVAVARRSARPVRAGRHGGGGRAHPRRDRRARSASPSTATTTSTASRPRSSCGGRSSCSAPTSRISFPSGCATATACSRRRSIGCTPTASRLVISVDCGIRGVEAALRARGARRRPDHHRPSRARHGAAARRSR